MSNFKVNFKSHKNKYIELSDSFETEGDSFKTSYKGKMPLDVFQKLRLALMTNITDPMNINSSVLEDALNNYFIIEEKEGNTKDFEISDAILILNAFVVYVDNLRVSNKKK